MISSPFILQQQKRYQQIKSSALVIQSYIRGWKVSLKEVTLTYVGFSRSLQRMISSCSLCRGVLLVSCPPCKQSDGKNKYYGPGWGSIAPCLGCFLLSFQGLFSEQEVLEIILDMMSISSHLLFAREAVVHEAEYMWVLPDLSTPSPVPSIPSLWQSHRLFCHDWKSRSSGVLVHPPHLILDPSRRSLVQSHKL